MNSFTRLFYAPLIYCSCISFDSVNANECVDDHQLITNELHSSSNPCSDIGRVYSKFNSGEIVSLDYPIDDKYYYYLITRSALSAASLGEDRFSPPYLDYEIVMLQIAMFDILSSGNLNNARGQLYLLAYFYIEYLRKDKINVYTDVFLEYFSSYPHIDTYMKNFKYKSSIGNYAYCFFYADLPTVPIISIIESDMFQLCANYRNSVK